jgi:hypothetical protein
MDRKEASATPVIAYVAFQTLSDHFVEKIISINGVPFHLVWHDQ